MVHFTQSAAVNGGWDAAFTTQSGLSVLDGQNKRRVILIDEGAAVSINHFTVQNGWHDYRGAGILSFGSLTFRDGLILNNKGPLGDLGLMGGGMYLGYHADLTLERTVATGNQATWGSFIYMTMDGSEKGIAVLNQVEAYANPATKEVVHDDYGYLQVNDSRFHNDNSSVFYLELVRQASLTNVVVYNNVSAVVALNSHVDMNHVSIHNNHSGGIVLTGSSLKLVNSSITNNHRVDGGGIALSEYSRASITNSTISGNRADQSGGGLYLETSSAYIYNSTISQNSAKSGGGIFNQSAYDEAYLNNSLVVVNAANNTIGANQDCTGIVISEGYSLVGDRRGCAYTDGPGDILAGSETGALLGDLEGEPTAGPVYLPLLPGSAAVDTGDPTGCKEATTPLLTDQRGKARFGACDIGAYELQPLGFSTIQVAPAKARTGETVTFTTTLKNPGSGNVSSVQFTNPLPVEFDYIPGTLNATRGSPAYQDGVFTWNGSMNSGDNVQIQYQARLSSSFPINGAAASRATITGSGETISRKAAVKYNSFQVFCPMNVYPCPPIYSDRFSNKNSGWPVVNNNQLLLEYLGGEYRILVRGKYDGVLAYSGFKTPASFTALVDVRNVGAIPGSYGFIFGLDPRDDYTFYTFEIYPNGGYGLYYWVGGYPNILAEGDSPAVRKGSATNLIKMERAKNSISISANGEQLASIVDGGDFNGDYIGLVALSYNQISLDVRFDNFAVYSATCPPEPDHQSGATNLSGGSGWIERENVRKGD